MASEWYRWNGNASRRKARAHVLSAPETDSPTKRPSLPARDLPAPNLLRPSESARAAPEDAPHSRQMPVSIAWRSLINLIDDPARFRAVQICAYVDCVPYNTPIRISSASRSSIIRSTACLRADSSDRRSQTNQRYPRGTQESLGEGRLTVTLERRWVSSGILPRGMRVLPQQRRSPN